MTYTTTTAPVALATSQGVAARAANATKVYGKAAVGAPPSVNSTRRAGPASRASWGGSP